MYSNNGKLLQCNLRGARLLHLDNGTRQKPHSSGDLVLDSPTIHPYELLTPTQHVDSIPPWVWHVPHFLAVRRGGYSPTTMPFCDIGTLSDIGYVPPAVLYARQNSGTCPDLAAPCTLEYRKSQDFKTNVILSITCGALSTQGPCSMHDALLIEAVC